MRAEATWPPDSVPLVSRAPQPSPPVLNPCHCSQPGCRHLPSTGLCGPWHYDSLGELLPCPRREHVGPVCHVGSQGRVPGEGSSGRLGALPSAKGPRAGAHVVWMDIDPPETLLPSAVLPTGVRRRWRAGSQASRSVLCCVCPAPPYPAAPRPVPAPPSTAFRRPGRGVRVSHVLKSWASRSVCVSLWTSAICPWCKVFSFTD